MNLYHTCRPSDAKCRQFSAVLRYPFLAHDERYKPIRHIGRINGRRFYLRAESTNEAFSIATIRDGHVLSVLATKITRRFDEFLPTHGLISIEISELLQELARPDTKQQHDLLLSELGRLHTTRIQTNLRGEEQSFNILDDFATVREHNTTHLVLGLPDFLVGEIIANRVLDVDAEVFALSPLEQRVWGWGRAFVGRDRSRTWIFDLERAHALCTSEDPPQAFASAIRDLVIANRLPGYALTRIRQHGRPCLQITTQKHPAAAINFLPATNTADDVNEEINVSACGLSAGPQQLS